MRGRPVGLAMRTRAALLVAGSLSLAAALTPGASSAASATPRLIEGTATTSPATSTLTAASTLALDTFTRANQTGWGAASGGGTWSTGSGLSITSNEGTMSSPGTSQYETLGSTTAGDGNGLVRFSIQASTDTAGIILRDQSNGNMYLARYDGTGNIAFMYRISGAWTIVAKVAFPITLKQFYWLRFVVQGSNVMLKAWPSGATEPSAWTWSGTSSGISAAGQMGLYGYAAPGAPVEFDSFSVTALSTPPTAALGVSPSAGAAPLPVTANASASTPGSNPISTFTFNFGDGTAVVGPQASAIAPHTYTSGGTFTVTVTVTDSVGATSTTTQGVTVGAPVAALSVSPLSGQPPLAVTANASASTDPIGISTYTFNFGDGTVVGPQPGSTAAHTYTSSGTYPVTVTVTDSTSASSTGTQTVVVATPPTAALGVSPSAGA